MQVVKKKSKLSLITKKQDKQLIKLNYFDSPKHEEFYEWLDNALPGEKFCYYSGNYVSGKAIAKFIQGLHKRGLVTMCQSKEGSIYHYWAVKIVFRKGRSY